MKTRAMLLLGAGLMSMALAGCADSSPATLEPAGVQDPVSLLTWDTEGINAFPAALLEARLQVDEETGCVVATGQRDDPDLVTGVIFPKGTVVSEDSKSLILLDGSELRFGDEVGLGGGGSDVGDGIIGNLKKCAFESYFTVNPPEG